MPAAPSPEATWQQCLDAADKSVKILAILIGAIWAYYKFVKGRVFKPRLEPNVVGEVFSQGERKFVIGSLLLKNIGASVFHIEAKGSGLRVLVTRRSRAGESVVFW